MAVISRSVWKTRGVPLGVVAAVTLTLSACQATPPQLPQGRDGVVPSYNADTGRLERISYDLNKDGKVDAWLFMDGTRAVRAELDENHDGTVDRWEYYRAGGQAAAGGFPRGELERAEQSTRFDGIVTRWEAYQAGVLKTVREDVSGDGQPDKWETWQDGSLAEVALDTKGTGQADRKIVYPADGSAPQMLVHADDGTYKPLSAAQ
jgi:hypothetical protein